MSLRSDYLIFFIASSSSSPAPKNKLNQTFILVNRIESEDSAEAQLDRSSYRAHKTEKAIGALTNNFSTTGGFGRETELKEKPLKYVANR